MAKVRRQVNRKRELFNEIMEGIGALADQRAGERALPSHSVEAMLHGCDLFMGDCRPADLTFDIRESPHLAVSRPPLSGSIEPVAPRSAPAPNADVLIRATIGVSFS